MADLVEVQPLVADLEPSAPGAAADAHLSVPGRAQDPRKVEYAASLGR
jgi:hypothetical protein